MQYYYHYIVVSESTGDTLNVFCLAVIEIEIENPIKRFYCNNSSSSLVIQNMTEIAKVNKNFNDLKPKNITKVVCNNKFKKREDNSYPTIVGIFTEFSAEQ